MPMWLRCVLCALLLVAAGGCAFGFLATFEPPGWVALRIGYGAASVICIAGAVVVMARRRSISSRGFPVHSRDPRAVD